MKFKLAVWEGMVWSVTFLLLFAFLRRGEQGGGKGWQKYVPDHVQDTAKDVECFLCNFFVPVSVS